MVLYLVFGLKFSMSVIDKCECALCRHRKWTRGGGKWHRLWGSIGRRGQRTIFVYRYTVAHGEHLFSHIYLNSFFSSLISTSGRGGLLEGLPEDFDYLKPVNAVGGKKEDKNGYREGGIRKSSPVTEKERRVRSLGKEVSIHNSESTCHLDSHLKENFIHCA